MYNVIIGMNMCGCVFIFGDDVFIGVNLMIFGLIKIGDWVWIGVNIVVLINVLFDSVVIGFLVKIYFSLLIFVKKKFVQEFVDV